MTKVIFVDMDDTLISTMELYDEAMAQLVAYLGNFGVTKEEVLKIGWHINDTLYKTMGYSPLRFPACFEQTLLHFIPNANESMIRTARSFAEGVFLAAAQIKPGVIEAIDLLCAQYPVYLVTQGDETVQKKRIDDLPFKDQFTDIYIVEKKSKDIYSMLASQVGIAPEDIVMIGDSLKSDIEPATEAGFQAVWIAGYNWGSVENAAQLPQRNAKKTGSFYDAAKGILAPPASKTAVPSNTASPNK